MSRKTVQTNDPWKPAQPYILAGLAETDRVANTQQPQLDAFSGMQMGTYGRVAPGAEAGITGAQGLVNSNIAGDNLRGNPFIDGILNSTRQNVIDGTNAQFSASGRYGSGAHTGVLASKLASAENDLRFNNYGMERQIQQNAIGQSQDLMRGSQSLLNNAAELPWISVAARNGNLRTASQGYGTTTSRTSDPAGFVTGLAGAAATAYASDPRVKDDLGVVGKRPDGLNLHKYVMKDDPTQTPKIGIMADEVAATRPDALGPNVGGVQTVDYGKLGMPGGPADLESLRQKTPDIRKPGVGGWLDSVVAPDPNSTRGKIGILGQYLMAQSGSPFEGLGKGLIGARQEGFDRADTEQRFDLQEQQNDALQGWREAQADAARARLERDDKPRIMQMRDGSVISINPMTNETTQISGPIAGPEPMVATSEGFVPRSQAAGKMPYRAPAAPRSPGRVQTKVIDGKAYYNIGGRWFDNAEGL